MVDRLRSHCAALLIVVGTVAVLVGSSSAMAQDQDESPAHRPARPEGSGMAVETAPDGRPMRAGSLIVKFRASSDSLERDAVHAMAGALVAEPLLLPDTVRAQVPTGTAAAALDAYRASPAVEYVEPDYVSGFRSR
jgi:hypothetical protein